ncbi:hypothetical protein J6590_096970 [Homalodisca vitripennis]|nr:hypothetical protein J6590_096970 [Homalodisca vitripennis]
MGYVTSIGVAPGVRGRVDAPATPTLAVLQDKPPLPYPPTPHNFSAGRLSAQQSVQFGVTCLAHANVNDKPPLPYPPISHNCPAGRLSAQQSVQFGVICLALMPMTNHPFPTHPSRITVQPVDSRHNSQFSLVSPVLRSCQCERNLDNRAVLQDKPPLPYPPTRIAVQPVDSRHKVSSVWCHLSCAHANVNVTLTIEPCCRTNHPFPTHPSRITVQPVDSRHNSQFSLVSSVLRSCQCERNLDNRAVLQDKPPLPYPPISHNCPAGRLSAQQTNYPFPTRPPRITVQPVDSRHNSQFSLVSPVLRSCQCERNLDNRAVLQDKPPFPTRPSRISVQPVDFGTTVSSVWCHLSCAHANVNVNLTIEPCCRTNYPFPTRSSRITVQPVDSRHNSQFSLVSPVLRSCQCERNLDNRAVLQDKPPLPYPPTPHNCPAGRLSAQQTNRPFPTHPSRITVQPVDSRHNSQFSLVSPVLRSCQCERNLDNRAVLQDKPPLPYPPTPHNCPAGRLSAQQLVQFGVICHALMPMTNYPFPTHPPTHNFSAGRLSAQQSVQFGVTCLALMPM